MKQILIVDDDRQVIKQVSTLLRSMGYIYGFIPRPEFLFKRLRDESFDLILMDINMPGVDGITLLKQLKVHPDYQDIDVIMMTGDTDGETLAKCFECGATDYITKPINELVLKARVKAALEKKAHIAEIRNQKKLLTEKQDIIAEQNNKLREYNVQLEEKVKERTEALNVLVHELQHTNEELDLFIYKSSHDLKGPVSSLLGLCNIMKIAPKDSATYVPMLEQLAKKMNYTLNRLMNIQGLKSKKVDRDEVELYQLIESTIAQLHNSEATNDIRFVIDVEEDYLLWSDIVFLEQVIANMIQNSIRFKKKGTGEKWIKIKTIDYEGDNVCISVQDNGIGISEEVCDKIFDLFFKGTQNPQGPGIGLYEAKIVMKKLGGRIWLHQTQEGVTDFRIMLPRAKMHKPATINSKRVAI